MKAAEFEAVMAAYPLDFHAFAMPRPEGDGGDAIYVTLRASKLIVSHVISAEEARRAQRRLAAALRTFDVARELAADVELARLDPERRIPSGDPASREQERRYRAKLAVRLGLAEDDIRAVFDLSADELAFLREEMAGA